MEVMLLVSFKIQENELKKYMIDISKGNELALEQFYEKIRTTSTCSHIFNCEKQRII